MSDKQFRLSLFGLFAIGAIVLFYELGDHRTFGSHEVFAAVPAREMLASGDWVVPRFGDVPRLRKPPLGYWVIASTASVLGEVNELTARIPAAVSGGLLAVLMGFWAGRWYGRSVGVAAGLVQLTSAYVLIFARKTEVDMLLCLLTTSVMFLAAFDPRLELRGDPIEPIRRRWTTIFNGRWTLIFGLLGLTWLAKFHFGLVMTAGAVGLFCLIQRHWRAMVAPINPVGWALLALGAGLWPYLVLQQLPDAWSVWRTETLGRLDELDKQPFWFYLPHLMWLTLPWTPLALFAVRSSWQKAWSRQGTVSPLAGNSSQQYVERSRERFLWIWLLVQLLVVSATANKHKHYIMPALPVFSIWSGRQLVRLVNYLKAYAPTIATLHHSANVVGTIVAAVTAGFVLAHKYPYLSESIVVAISVLATGVLCSLWLWKLRRPVHGLSLTGVTSLAVYMITMSSLMPGRDHRQPAADFAKQTRDSVPPGTPVFTYALGMDSTVYYLDEPVQRVESPEELQQKLKEHPEAHVLTYEHLAPQLKKVGEAEELKRMEIDEETGAKPKHPPLIFARVQKSNVH